MLDSNVQVIQMWNQFLDFVQSVADLSYQLVLIVFFTIKESNLHTNESWLLLNVLNESHIYSSISSYVDLSVFVTSLQRIRHTWYFIKLSRVLTQFQLPIQDIVFEETEFPQKQYQIQRNQRNLQYQISNIKFKFNEISNSKFLVLLKGSRVIIFEDSKVGSE